MIQVNRIYLIFNRLVTKKFLVDTSDVAYISEPGGGNGGSFPWGFCIHASIM